MSVAGEIRLRLRLINLKEHTRDSLWFIPGLCVVSACLLALALNRVDHYAAQGQTGWFLFGGGADGARSLLSTIAASLITFTGIVFSVTMLVLQLASAQFSPRVLRNFFQDAPSKWVLGVFSGTLTYSMLVLSTVRDSNDASEALGRDAFVPAFSVWLALLLVVVCVGLFIYFLNHLANAIRVNTVISHIVNDTRGTLRKIFPDKVGSPGPPVGIERPLAPPTTTIPSPRAGTLTTLDEGRLMELAVERGLVVELCATIGDFVPENAPLWRVWGDPHAARPLAGVVALGLVRTIPQDPAFGFRLLVDIAERALSPGVNDPTTAVQALDAIHELLRELANRDIPSPYRVDDDGNLRAILPRPGWEDYVHLALDEIRHYGGGSIQVARRTHALLDDLLAVAPVARRPPLELQRTLLNDAIKRAFPDAADRERSFIGSTQGNGPR